MKPGSPAYMAAHYQVYRLHGKPKRCDRCGLTDPTKRYEWVNTSGEYADPEDYIRLCVPCHRSLDRRRGHDRKEGHAFVGKARCSVCRNRSRLAIYYRGKLGPGWLRRRQENNREAVTRYRLKRKLAA